MRSSASMGRAGAYAPTSLNMAVRKRETDRIERENHAFAKRLFEKQAITQKKSLDREYQAHLKYRKQIQKVQGVPVSVSNKKNQKGMRSHTRGHTSQTSGLGMAHQPGQGQGQTKAATQGAFNDSSQKELEIKEQQNQEQEQEEQHKSNKTATQQQPGDSAAAGVQSTN